MLNAWLQAGKCCYLVTPLSVALSLWTVYWVSVDCGANSHQFLGGVCCPLWLFTLEHHRPCSADTDYSTIWWELMSGNLWKFGFTAWKLRWCCSWRLEKIWNIPIYPQFFLSQGSVFPSNKCASWYILEYECQYIGYGCYIDKVQPVELEQVMNQHYDCLG